MSFYIDTYIIYTYITYKSHIIYKNHNIIFYIFYKYIFISYIIYINIYIYIISDHIYITYIKSVFSSPTFLSISFSAF